jgi:hypothetical protein
MRGHAVSRTARILGYGALTSMALSGRPACTLWKDAAELADRPFLETLIRIHRMGEGVGFTRLQPVGAKVDPGRM